MQAWKCETLSLIHEKKHLKKRKTEKTKKFFICSKQNYFGIKKTMLIITWNYSSEFQAKSQRKTKSNAVLMCNKPVIVGIQATYSGAASPQRHWIFHLQQRLSCALLKYFYLLQLALKVSTAKCCRLNPISWKFGRCYIRNNPVEDFSGKEQRELFFLSGAV